VQDLREECAEPLTARGLEELFGRGNLDLVNRLEAEGRAGRQGRLADFLTRLDFVILEVGAVAVGRA
jgi:hypothetical protein